MTRLELAQSLVQEAGIAGSGPITTIDQTGEMKRVVTWIDRAYNYIQIEFETWLLKRKDFSFNTVAGTAEYSASGIASDFSSWKTDSFRIYNTATGISDEQWLDYVAWDDFRDAYLLSTQRTTQGRPVQFTVKPDKSIQTFPVADDTYTIIGEYYETPDIMTADTDEPQFPTRYHEAIMWLGLKYYGAWSAEPDKYAVGRDEYDNYRRKMELTRLPRLQWGKPLA